MNIRHALMLVTISVGLAACASEPTTGDPTSSSPEKGDESANNSPAPTGHLASFAKAHPTGKYVSRSEYNALMKTEKVGKADATGPIDKDFNDGVGTSGMYEDGFMCYCDNDYACNNMFTYYCDGDPSYDYCYVYYDNYGYLWGQCQCQCIY